MDLKITKDTEKKVLNDMYRNIKIGLARKNFFEFCKLLAPDFYMDTRPFLKELCEEIQEFYFSDNDILIINAPPRHGKSRTVTLFVLWMLGIKPSSKIMTGSYNEKVSERFSKQTLEIIRDIRYDGEERFVYTDIFPNNTLKKNSQSSQFWTLEGQYSSYIATSPTGTATGFGCSLLIIDDLIKNDKEANNSNVLEDHWNWYNNTMKSRIEKGGKTIIIMTRWNTKDLSGRLLHYGKVQNLELIKHLSYKVLKDDGTMLCEEIMDKKKYLKTISNMSEDIASANYQQIPIDIKGKLYGEFNTYDTLPTETYQIRAYIDTADTGSDFLCMVIYAPINKRAYVLDVLYTKADMSITENLVAEMLFNWKVDLAHIESNSGGLGFKKNVERILWQDYNTNRTVLVPFHQSQNKETRILTYSAWVSKNIIFPNDWKIKYKKFAIDIFEFQREGKNKNDDAPDVLTGIAEKINETHFSFD